MRRHVVGDVLSKYKRPTKGYAGRCSPVSAIRLDSDVEPMGGSPESANGGTPEVDEVAMAVCDVVDVFEH